MRHFIAAPLACLTLLFASTPALAAPGPHLSWDHCWGDGQVANKSFACDTNAGSEALVVSYESPVARSDRLGVEITLHIAATGLTLPAWWSVAGAGACRPGALTASVTGDPASACVDPYHGVSAGGIASYDVGLLGPNTVRVRAFAAVPPTAPFEVGPGVEDFAMRLNLSHSLTAGASACGGCFVRLCLGVGIINLVSAVPSDKIQLLGSSGGGGSPATVTWQGATVLSYVNVFEQTGIFSSLNCSPSPPDPTQRASWGAVKSLYR